MARYIPGGRVVLADGTYELGAAVSLSRQKAHLQGVGGATHLRPSTTGFNRLVKVDDIHCRVGYMLLVDSGDTLHDIRYGVLDQGQSWTVVEAVHTHGAELAFSDATGPSVEQLENHPQPTPADNPGQNGVYFLGTDPANASYCRWPRLHGGWIDKVRRDAVRAEGVLTGSIEGTLIYRGSMENTGTYSCIRVVDCERTSVKSCNAFGDLFVAYGVNEGSAGDANSILGNRLEGSGTTADLNVTSTNSLSGGNHADGTIK